MKTLDDVVAAARNRNSVVIFAIEWTDLAGTLRRHSMIAVRTLRGVQFADYGGKFISDLSQLAMRGSIWASSDGYNVATTATKGAALLIRGMETIGTLEKYASQVFGGGALFLEGMQAIETPHGVELAIPVAPAVGIE